MNKTKSSPVTSAGAVRSFAAIKTGRAIRYMTQLCKHFEHKCPVTFDTGSLVEFSGVLVVLELSFLELVSPLLSPSLPLCCSLQGHRLREQER